MLHAPPNVPFTSSLMLWCFLHEALKNGCACLCLCHQTSSVQASVKLRMSLANNHMPMSKCVFMHSSDMLKPSRAAVMQQTDIQISSGMRTSCLARRQRGFTLFVFFEILCLYVPALRIGSKSCRLGDHMCTNRLKRCALQRLRALVGLNEDEREKHGLKQVDV